MQRYFMYMRYKHWNICIYCDKIQFVYVYHMEKIEKERSQKAVLDLQDLSEVQSRARNGTIICVAWKHVLESNIFYGK